ncbi:MAG: hypothetical protein HY063_06035 [Bacteroidetes bacterium]|nr:hypothetical protein [Bacteroidota bacterium]
MKTLLLPSALLIFSLGIFPLLEGGAGGCKAQTQSKSPWLTTGNVSTTQSASTDFIGFSNTTVQAPLIFKTMGQDRLHIAPDGKIGIGITPTEAFELGFGNARFPNNVDVIGIIHVGPPVGIGPPLPIVPGGPPVVEVHGNTSILGNLASNGILAATDVQTSTLTVKSTGNINSLTVNNLAGSGDRIVFTDANGNLKVQGPPTSCIDPFWRTDGNVVANCFLGSTNAADLIFKTNNTEQMRILTNGNVGIGTATPAYPLEVTGTIKAKEVKVCVSGCDFVFENNYNLLPIKHRKEKVLPQKHLFNIASASEMQKGQNMGEFTMGLLQNLEEHELYLYQHDERIEKLEIENTQLKTELDALKKQIDELKKK